MLQDWLQAVDLPMACGLPEGNLECMVALTLANFFGWCTSSVFSVPLALVKWHPDEHGHPTVEFETSVFKVSPLYPVSWLALQELPGLFKVVLTFVVACKGQRGWEFLCKVPQHLHSRLTALRSWRLLKWHTYAYSHSYSSGGYYCLVIGIWMVESDKTLHREKAASSPRRLRPADGSRSKVGKQATNSTAPSKLFGNLGKEVPWLPCGK